MTRHPEWDETVQGFARQLSAQVAADRVGGVEAGIVVDGELVWHQAFGWSSRDEGAPLTPGGAFRTASISRTVTAILLLRLVNRGVIALDDPVEPYLPELAEARNGTSHLPRVTFRHLASHTSGLARNYQEGLAGPQEDWQERVAASFGNLAFDTVPGSRYQDSPIGFGALGLALERAAGRPYMAVDPETRIGVVLLRNYLRGRTDLRAGAVGLVTQLGDLARGRRSWVETLVPPMLLLAGALLAGFLLHRLLGSPNVQTRIHP